MLFCDLDHVQVVIAKRADHTMIRALHPDEHEVFVGVSIGIAIATGGPERSVDPKAPIRHADAATHWAKARGRGRYQFFEPGIGRAGRGPLRPGERTAPAGGAARAAGVLPPHREPGRRSRSSGRWCSGGMIPSSSGVGHRQRGLESDQRMGALALGSDLTHVTLRGPCP